MKFVDYSEITITGGHGGSGSSSFRREKFTPKGGPDGGDGGNGGSVIFEGTHNLQSLMDLKLKKKYKAGAGETGLPRKKHGSDGKDCLITVPFGTMVFNEEDQLIADITPDQPQFLAAKGGKGGKGNTHFATARHQAPRYAQQGLPGESKTIKLELRMIAEVGLIGLPNAGKSTLLKTLTNASPKISDYPFTTLYPNLGNLKYNHREILIADIPGLIKGASEGVGLGHDFLRHVDRTKLLLHLVAADEDPTVTYNNYAIIMKELEKSHYTKDKKEMILLLTKTDLVTPEVIHETCNLFERQGLSPLPISSFARTNIDPLIETIYNHKDIS